MKETEVKGKEVKKTEVKKTETFIDRIDEIVISANKEYNKKSFINSMLSSFVISDSEKAIKDIIFKINWLREDDTRIDSILVGACAQAVETLSNNWDESSRFLYNSINAAVVDLQQGKLTTRVPLHITRDPSNTNKIIFADIEPETSASKGKDSPAEVFSQATESSQKRLETMHKEMLESQEKMQEKMLEMQEKMQNKMLEMQNKMQKTIDGLTGPIVKSLAMCEQNTNFMQTILAQVLAHGFPPMGTQNEKFHEASNNTRSNMQGPNNASTANNSHSPFFFGASNEYSSKATRKNAAHSEPRPPSP